MSGEDNDHQTLHGVSLCKGDSQLCGILWVLDLSPLEIWYDRIAPFV